MLWDTRHHQDWRIIPIIAFSLLLLIPVFILLNKNRSAPSPTSQVHVLDALPNFLAKDTTGRMIGAKDLASKNVFVQFTDPNDVNDTDFIGAIVSAWKCTNLAILLITSAPKDLFGIIGLDRDNLFILPDEIDQLRSLFKAPSRTGGYYLFDDAGKLVAQGNTYEGYEKQAKIVLTLLLAGRRFTGAEIALEGSYLNDISWLAQLNKVVLSGDKEYYLFALFASFCAACQQGSIVSDLNNVFLAKRHFLEVFSVVYPQDLSQSDINSLRDQAKIAYPIVGADTELSARWALLIDTYNSSLLNNILILADRSGRILKVFDVTCQCYGEFINLVRALEGPAM